MATSSASRARYDIPAMGSDGDVPGHHAVRALLEFLAGTQPLN